MIKKQVVEYGTELCLWQIEIQDERVWKTSCEELFVMIDGSPLENGMGYCPFCGRRIQEKS